MVGVIENMDVLISKGMCGLLLYTSILRLTKY